jgi:hypothetical protein
MRQFGAGAHWSGKLRRLSSNSAYRRQPLPRADRSFRSLAIWFGLPFWNLLVLAQPDALQAYGREDVAGGVRRERRKTGARLLNELIGKIASIPPEICPFPPPDNPALRAE